MLAVEKSFATVVTLGEGDTAVDVQLTGYADRLELDVDGAVVVVDLKTGRAKPTDTSVKKHVQLALYQLAIDHGAVDDLVADAPARAGGAELVQLGILDDSTSAVVQTQDVTPDDHPLRRDLRAHLRRASDLVRQESFPAIVGPQCRDCSFLALCPAQGAGSVTGS